MSEVPDQPPPRRAGPARLAMEAAALMSLGRRKEARASLERALAARWNDVDDAPRRAAESLLRALEGAPASP